MIGLIKKELLMLKSNIKTLGVILIIYVILAFQGSFDISFLPSFLVVMLIISNFSYDEFNKWDAYAATLPNGRKNIVRARYIATLLLNFVVTVLVALLALVIAFKNGTLNNYAETLLTMYATFLATIVIQSFMFPMAYKYGREKAGILIFVFVFGIIFIGGLLIKYIEVEKIIDSLTFLNNTWFITLLIFAFGILFISYIISEKIYLKKEF